MGFTSRVGAGAILMAICVLPPAVARAAETAFPEDTWTLELTGSFVDEIRYSQADMGMATIGVNYYPWDNFAIGAAASGYFTDQPSHDGYGVGLELTVRWHLLTFDRWTVFVDGAVGRTYYDPELPDGGTHWNWSLRAGAGLTYDLNDSMSLIGGGRYFHVSNADQFGRDHNPGFDGLQFYVGVMMRL